MTQIQFVRRCALLPAVFPALGLAADVAAFVVRVRLPQVVEEAIGYAMWGIVIAGIPYALLMWGSLAVLRDKGLAAHVAVMLSTPAVLAGAVPAVLLLLGMGDGEAMSAAMFFASRCLAVGYSYVGVCLVGLVIGTWDGHLQRDVRPN